MGDKSFLSTVASLLGQALYRQRKVDEAERYSELSEELGSSDDRVNEAAWRVLRAKVCLAGGDAARAEALAREAVEIATGTDYLELAADARLDLARILVARGDAGSAAAAECARSLYEQKGNVVGVHRATRLLDELASRA